MGNKDPREHIYYRILKEVANDLLRDCDTLLEATKLANELKRVFHVALVDVMLNKCYGDDK